MIKIAGRFKPFSRMPGAVCLIPGKAEMVQAYPKKIETFDLSGNKLCERPFDAALGKFRVELELEHGYIAFYGALKPLYLSKEGFSETKPRVFPYNPQRISFGCHKKQDADLIRRRQDIKEILPIWYKLSTFYEKKEPQNFDFLSVYNAFLSPLFAPFDQDRHFTGTAFPFQNPLEIIEKGGSFIHSLFISDTLEVQVPKGFAFGRALDLPVNGGKVSIEWSKNFLRQVIVDGDIAVSFPKNVKKFRTRHQGSKVCFDNFLA